jgi:hypothetical protein
MPDDKNIQKEKVYFLYYCETEKYDEAFEIIQSIEFEKSDYLECELALKVVREKQAWEMEVKILERLFELEKDEKKKGKMPVARDFLQLDPMLFQSY